MNEDKLKAMWSKSDTVMGASEYKSPSIEQFISGRSTDAVQKIKNMIVFDLALKALVMVVLLIDFTLFFGTYNVMLITLAGIVLLLPLLYFQRRLLNRFIAAADNGQTTRDKLASMLTYLKTQFFSTLLSVAITYLFVFVAGSLVYFYATYGYVRPLDGVDVIVFLGFILIGIVFNFFVNRGQVSYQIKHLETCLADLNENNLELVSENIELQRKQDRSNKILLALVVIIGFLLLIAVFMNIGAVG